MHTLVRCNITLRQDGIYLKSQSHHALGHKLINITTEAAKWQRALKYIHIPAALFLSLNKIASNLGGDIY
jgi:hypothetical protein